MAQSGLDWQSNGSAGLRDATNSKATEKPCKEKPSDGTASTRIAKACRSKDPPRQYNKEQRVATAKLSKALISNGNGQP
jgi:hypothetical protein